MRGAVILLGESLLALDHLTREADDDVVLVGDAVDGDSAKVRTIDFHGDTPFPS